MGKSEKSRRQLKRLHKINSERSKAGRPNRLAIVMLMGKHEYLTLDQESIVEGWVLKERWLEASNISLLYEQGHTITEDMLDLYERWQYAKNSVMRDRRKNKPYLRKSSYHTELIANPECSRVCPCCGMTYTVARTHKSRWVKNCMFCHGVCNKKTGCKTLSHYKPHQNLQDPYPEALSPRDGPVFP